MTNNCQAENKAIDWKNLGFRYTETRCIVRCSFRDGHWEKPYPTTDKTLSIHACATCLHYGQAAFEGIKVFRGMDNRIRIFRWESHAQRLNSSAQAAYMANVPQDIFWQCLEMVIRENADFIPPYESGATLYIRPLLIGTMPKLGVGPGDQFELVFIASPIGAYYSISSHVQTFIIDRSVDRSGPLGMGAFKVAGNYVSAFRATVPAHQMGYDCIFVDARYRKYIEECSSANFIGICHNVYMTPKSPSILPSITNLSLMNLAGELGMKVKQKRIAVDDLENFSEVGACGTACVVTPMDKIIDPLKQRIYSYTGNNPILTRLTQRLQDIQYGREQDVYGWCTVIPH